MVVKTAEPHHLGCTLVIPLISYVTLDKLIHLRSLVPLTVKEE